MDLKRLAMIVEKDCRLTRSQLILLGVSGGADSLCLMDALARLGFRLCVAHFNHQLRAESAADSARVASTARRLGLPFSKGSQDVAAFAVEHHLSLEEAARVLRYRFLFSQARALEAQAVAVGHTADDQVETVLMHFLRGAGLAGLRGMAFRVIQAEWDASIPLVRPLLPFWREETVMYCQDQGLDPVQDASNLDTTFLRNRLRHELIPYLETYNPQVRRAIWRMSQVFAGEEAVVQRALDLAWQKCFVAQEKGIVRIKVNELRALAPGLLRAVLRKAAALILPGLRDIDYDAVERTEAFLENVSTGQIDLVRGLRVFIESDQLVIMKTGISLELSGWPQLASEEVVRMEIPGHVDLPSGWHLSACWVEEGDIPPVEVISTASPWEAWLAADPINARLSLRRPRPGDRFQPFGMHGHSMKLSDFWINQKHPRGARPAWPLIVLGEQIAWVPGFRPAETFRLNKNTRKALYLRLFRVRDGEEFNPQVPSRGA